MHEVLQADWQDAGHSPQPPVFKVLFKIALFTVLMCFFMINTPKCFFILIYFTVFSNFLQVVIVFFITDLLKNVC